METDRPVLKQRHCLANTITFRQSASIFSREGKYFGCLATSPLLFYHWQMSEVSFTCTLAHHDNNECPFYEHGEFPKSNVHLLQKNMKMAIEDLSY